MAKRFYLVDELPSSYGKLIAIAGRQWLQDQEKRALENSLIRQADLYRQVRVGFQKSQKRGERWSVKVARFEEILQAAINTSRLGRIEYEIESRIVKDNGEAKEEYWCDYDLCEAE
ncbi:V3 [Plantago lanceolata latent virus]|uniref:V3 n=1 Tax=Plantago lanceolata latent virus TaxID=1830242 RepID=A0A166V5M6_9GEMI|nr:V3 [Plantago lanceolata latent virus]ANA76383.1 V3 [Plantago lanceolata latent virus]